MHRLPRFPTLLLIALIAPLLTGCQGASERVVPVSGKVTLNGQPLVGASISFQPITDKSSAATGASGSYGKTDAEGKYTLQLISPDQPGALIGKHGVTISTAVSENPSSDDLKTRQPEKVPARYRDGTFTLDVPAEGTDQANIDIVSK